MTRRTSGRSLREIIILLRVALDNRYPGDPRLPRKIIQKAREKPMSFICCCDWRMGSAVATGLAGRHQTMGWSRRGIHKNVMKK